MSRNSILNVLRQDLIPLRQDLDAANLSLAALTVDDSEMTTKDALMDKTTLSLQSAEQAKRQLSNDLENVKARLKDEVIAKSEESANRRKLAAEARDLQRLDAEIGKSYELADTLALYKIGAEQATEKLEAAEMGRL